VQVAREHHAQPSLPRSTIARVHHRIHRAAQRVHMTPPAHEADALAAVRQRCCRSVISHSSVFAAVVR
jgi:hypothetical protein